MGIPFLKNGRDETGLDCWGLVMKIFSDQNILLPDPFKLFYQEAVPQKEWGPWILSKFPDWFHVEPRKGAIVVFAERGERPNHVGVMLDRNHFIHAVKGIGVVIGNMNRCPYKVIGCYEYRTTK